jgi:hypothetical protein
LRGSLPQADNDFNQPRGSGLGVDQDDSATGTFTFGPGLTFLNGPQSWLDTHLTDNEMRPVLPGAGISNSDGVTINKMLTSQGNPSGPC